MSIYDMDVNEKGRQFYIKEAIIQQVKYVIEGQNMDVETLCTLLCIGPHDIVNAFEDDVISNAAQFGVDPNIVADTLEADIEAEFNNEDGTYNG